ncbi:hypothetical protein [uncultured Paraglaciecola sp.]|uniref:hypothetical protein n=1 Tax=uncultured Paraglaciecola sp. TaxID=1765024 RepID=UPI002601D545|nr:hypothetical protein [uncultured Paraglaciecola sp.]
MSLGKLDQIHAGYIGPKPMYEGDYLEQILDLFETSNNFVPEWWSDTDGKKYPYDRTDLLSTIRNRVHADLFPSVSFGRKKTPKNDCYVGISLEQAISSDLGKSTARKHWQPWMELMDKLVAIFEPSFGTVGFIPEWRNETGELSPRDITAVEFLYSSRINGTQYWLKAGLRGVATRTYFGEHFIDLFGRENLLSTPNTVIKELDWGGIRMDLMDDITTVNEEELFANWRAAMDHLLQFEVFAHMKLDDKQRVQLTKGARWEPSPKMRLPERK